MFDKLEQPVSVSLTDTMLDHTRLNFNPIAIAQLEETIEDLSRLRESIGRNGLTKQLFDYVNVNNVLSLNIKHFPALENFTNDISMADSAEITQSLDSKISELELSMESLLDKVSGFFSFAINVENLIKKIENTLHDKKLDHILFEKEVGLFSKDILKPNVFSDAVATLDKVIDLIGSSLQHVDVSDSRSYAQWKFDVKKHATDILSKVTETVVHTRNGTYVSYHVEYNPGEFAESLKAAGYTEHSLEWFLEKLKETLNTIHKVDNIMSHMKDDIKKHSFFKKLRIKSHLSDILAYINEYGRYYIHAQGSSTINKLIACYK